MPLKLNVGSSKKVGEANYGSRGASVNLEMELDSGLIAEPTKLKEKIRQLFTLVRSSLAEELNGGTGTGHAEQSPENGATKAPPAQNGHRNGSGGGSRPATQSQVKAIHAIARSRKINLPNLLRERFRIGRPDDLSLREASQLIDDLKGTENGGD